VKRLMLALVAIGAMLTSACTISVDGKSISVVRGSGIVVSEARQVSGFNAVSFSGMGEIVITQGQSESLTVEAEDNILPQIKTEIRNGTLSIGFKREKWQDWVNPTKPIKFSLSVKDLSSIESSGLGNVQASGLKAGKFTLKLTGAGNLKIEHLDCTSVSSTLAGAGSIELSGTTVDQTASLSGLGSYRAGDLASDKAKVTVSGAGSATVWPSESLEVTISGAGSINYYGSPSVQKTITGVGSVKSLGAK
jgi:hypothetical protein